MSTIRVIYHGGAPDFPATDQHPRAERFYVAAGKVLTGEQWAKRKTAALNAAQNLVYGTANDKKIAAMNEREPERRGERKQALAAKLAELEPKLDYVVDAIGAPTMAEITATLSPPA